MILRAGIAVGAANIAIIAGLDNDHILGNILFFQLINPLITP